MAKYLYVYHGGNSMPQDKEAIDKAMRAWGGWFGQLGAAVADAGNPTKGSVTVRNGSVADSGANPATGYSIILADSMDDAVAKARGCPIHTHGGSVEISEILAM